MARGTLRVYLGAAPGVGKTFAMLAEGNRRAARGTDVVVAVVETHGRAATAAQIGGLEIVPRAVVEHRGTQLDEMDLDAVLARRPEVALVDELAHTNAPGSRHAKRWQDVDALLDAGIDVVATVNVQHLESLNDVVRQITGVEQRETIPDAVVRAADQIELVDMTPDALRRRMAHGNVYPPERIDTSLAHYFRVGNLTALRELALLWVADQVDAALHDYRQRQGIEEPWETRERVAVAVTGAPDADHLIRRAARLANRSKAELVGIHVDRADGLAGDEAAGPLEAHQALLSGLGGRYLEVVDADIGRGLVQAAIDAGATQLLIGATRRSRFTELVHGSVISRIVQEAGNALDVHIISTRLTDDADRATPEAAPLPRRTGSVLPPRRRSLAALAVIVGLPALTVAALPVQDRLGFTSIGFVYLLAVVGIAVLGGRVVGIAGALAGFLLLNWFFADPVHTFTLNNERDAIALTVFVAVGSIVSVLVERTARRSADARRARRDAGGLAAMAGALLREDDPLPDLLGVLVRTFALDGAALLQRHDGGWRTEVASGAGAPTEPDDADLDVDVGDGVHLVVAGRLGGDDRRVLAAFADQLAVALAGRRLRATAADAAAAARAGEVRDIILAAASHDLRTPLTTIKTSASALLDPDVHLDPELQRELLVGIDHEADRLNDLVGNLLDLGRLRSAALTVQPRAVHLTDVVAGALHPWSGGRCRIEIPDELTAQADPVLFERAVANIIDNAVRHGGDGPVTLTGRVVDDRVELRVIDHGPGIPANRRASVFQAFQRLDERPEAVGVGLGLTVARGFIDAMDGTLEIEDTPGGGTTMVVTLPRSTS